MIRHRTRFKVSFYFYGGRELIKTGGSLPFFPASRRSKPIELPLGQITLSLICPEAVR